MSKQHCAVICRRLCSRLVGPRKPPFTYSRRSTLQPPQRLHKLNTLHALSSSHYPSHLQAATYTKMGHQPEGWVPYFPPKPWYRPKRPATSSKDTSPLPDELTNIQRREVEILETIRDIPHCAICKVKIRGVIYAMKVVRDIGALPLLRPPASIQHRCTGSTPAPFARAR